MLGTGGTSLGGGQSSGIRMAVKNVGASNILRGQIVSIVTTASNPAIQYNDMTGNSDFSSNTVHPNTEVPVLPVIVGDLDGNYVPGAWSAIGVAATDIPINKTGEIIVGGLARILFADIAAKTAGTVIGGSGAVQGTVTSASSASTDNPIGMLLEAYTVTPPNTQLLWAFVNFTAVITGLPANAAYTRSQKYQNKAF